MPLNPIQPLPFFSTEANHQILSHSHQIFHSHLSQFDRGGLFLYFFSAPPGLKCFFPQLSLCPSSIFLGDNYRPVWGVSLLYPATFYHYYHLQFTFHFLQCLPFTSYYIYRPVWGLSLLYSATHFLPQFPQNGFSPKYFCSGEIFCSDSGFEICCIKTNFKK